MREILQYKPESENVDYLTACGIYRSDIQAFQRILQGSGMLSIDEFLEGRRDLIPMGKALIALTLSKHEQIDRLFDPEIKGKSWYDYLFTKMTIGTKDIKANSISFITYNYDRSLEAYFHRALMNRFSLDGHNAEMQVRNLPLVHIHGQLGSIFDQNTINFYAPIRSGGDLKRATNGISIIHEAKEDSNLIYARRLLAEAKVVAFLGFGYNRSNMERLQLENCSSASIYGTTFGMKKAEVSAIDDMFDPVRFNDHPGDILDALRDWGILETPFSRLFPPNPTS